MPRLKCTFAEVLAILEAHGFALLRHEGTSHRRYRAEIAGVVYLVDLCPHNWNDDVPIGTLQAIIRQSGIPKKKFRK